jgi:hypothetical protein
MRNQAGQVLVIALLQATAHNNVVRASARLRRAPGYTAPKACRDVSELAEVWRCMAERHSCLAPRREPLNVICHGPAGHGVVGLERERERERERELHRDSNPAQTIGSA